MARIAWLPLTVALSMAPAAHLRAGEALATPTTPARATTSALVELSASLVLFEARVASARADDPGVTSRQLAELLARDLKLSRKWLGRAVDQARARRDTGTAANLAKLGRELGAIAPELQALAKSTDVADRRRSLDASRSRASGTRRAVSGIVGGRGHELEAGLYALDLVARAVKERAEYGADGRVRLDGLLLDEVVAGDAGVLASALAAAQGEARARQRAALGEVAGSVALLRTARSESAARSAVAGLLEKIRALCP